MGSEAWKTARRDAAPIRGLMKSRSKSSEGVLAIPGKRLSRPSNDARTRPFAGMGIRSVGGKEHGREERNRGHRHLRAQVQDVLRACLRSMWDDCQTHRRPMQGMRHDGPIRISFTSGVLSVPLSLSSLYYAGMQGTVPVFRGGVSRGTTTSSGVISVDLTPSSSFATYCMPHEIFFGWAIDENSKARNAGWSVSESTNLSFDYISPGGSSSQILRFRAWRNLTPTFTVQSGQTLGPTADGAARTIRSWATTLAGVSIRWIAMGR